jgi:hypothetical protein
VAKYQTELEATGVPLDLMHSFGKKSSFGKKRGSSVAHATAEGFVGNANDQKMPASDDNGTQQDDTGDSISPEAEEVTNGGGGGNSMDNEMQDNQKLPATDDNGARGKFQVDRGEIDGDSLFRGNRQDDRPRQWQQHEGCKESERVITQEHVTLSQGQKNTEE